MDEFNSSPFSVLPLPALAHAVITVACYCPIAAFRYALSKLRGAGKGALDELGFGNWSLGNLSALALVSAGEAALGKLDLLVGSEVQAVAATGLVGFPGYFVDRR